MKIKLSDFGKLNVYDFIKGLIMAVGTPVLYLVQELIPGWDISPIAKAAISAGITYLLKNLFTGQPKEIEIDPKKTNVVDRKTKQIIA